MNNKFSTTPSKEMLAINGPIEEIEELQTNLAAILADVLEKRNSIKNYLGPEPEKEIERICSSFTAANRRIISQRLLNAYCHNRYPVYQTHIPKDAPQTAFDEFNSNDYGHGGLSPTEIIKK